MKIFILILAAILLFSPAFSQKNRPEMTAKDYRKLSKDQQIGGIILLVAGVSTLAIA